MFLYVIQLFNYSLFRLSVYSYLRAQYSSHYITFYSYNFLSIWVFTFHIRLYYVCCLHKFSLLRCSLVICLPVVKMTDCTNCSYSDLWFWISFWHHSSVDCWHTITRTFHWPWNNKPGIQTYWAPLWFDFRDNKTRWKTTMSITLDMWPVTDVEWRETETTSWRWLTYII